MTRFADGDLVMRYLGLGVGHVGMYPHNQDRSRPPPVPEVGDLDATLDAEDDDGEWENDLQEILDQADEENIIEQGWEMGHEEDGMSAIAEEEEGEDEDKEEGEDEEEEEDEDEDVMVIDEEEEGM